MASGYPRRRPGTPPHRIAVGLQDGPGRPRATVKGSVVEVTAELVALVIAVGLVAGLCDRFGWPTPLVLVVVGAAASFLPHVPEIELDPDLVLHALLPPLLYATTQRTSLFDFRHNKLSIVLMSVVLVVFSTVVVGWVTWLVLPGVAVAAALALGAVVAPPDAVAASAKIGRASCRERV